MSPISAGGRASAAGPELIRHVWLDDPELCERCGGRMRIAGVCTSPRDDDAIRRGLEARGKWAPTWARAHPESDAPGAMSPAMSPTPSTAPSLAPPADPSDRASDPWDHEWIPDPWAEAEDPEDGADCADTAIDPSEDPAD